MTKSSSQLPLELPVKPRYGAEDFLVSSSNETAYAMIEAWPEWPSRALLLVGPSGAGKSHMAAIWAARTKAMTLSARSLPQADAQALARAPAILVEDIDAIKGEEAAENALFHLLNSVKERAASLLMTSQHLPVQMELRTADVRSRLREATLIELGSPDDALIRAVIVKLFVDRQLVVDIGVVEFLARRLERSLDAVRSFVAVLDREALALNRRITRQMAGDVLKRIDGANP